MKALIHRVCRVARRRRKDLVLFQSLTIDAETGFKAELYCPNRLKSNSEESNLESALIVAR